MHVWHRESIGPFGPNHMKERQLLMQYVQTDWAAVAKKSSFKDAKAARDAWRLVRMKLVPDVAPRKAASGGGDDEGADGSGEEKIGKATTKARGGRRKRKTGMSRGCSIVNLADLTQLPRWMTAMPMRTPRPRRRGPRLPNVQARKSTELARRLVRTRLRWMPAIRPMSLSGRRKVMERSLLLMAG